MLLHSRRNLSGSRPLNPFSYLARARFRALSPGSPYSEGKPMKSETKYMLCGYVGLLGLVTLGIMLNSIQGLLPAIAVKVLIVLLILAGLVFLYLLYWLYSHFHKTYHAIQTRKYELRAAKQQLRIEQERWEVERAGLLLGQH